MTGAVIELDREHVGVPQEEPGLPPGWWRWLGLALAAMLSGTTLVAATPPSGSQLTEVAHVNAASMVTMRLTGSMLFAVLLGGGPHLVGYRLADGAQRWSVPLDLSGNDVQIGGRIQVVDDVVLVSVVGTSAAARTVAVDGASGRELWRSDLSLMSGPDMGRSVVLGAYLNPEGRLSPPPYPGTPGTQLPVLLRSVEARTGRLIWTYQIPAGWRFAMPSTAAGGEPTDGFVAISPNGRATTVNLADGTELISATIDATAADQHSQGDLPTGPALSVYGDQLVLVTTRQGRPTLAAYQVSTLTLEWTSAVSTMDATVNRCGQWLCVVDNQGTHGIAPDTGARAWTMANINAFRGWAAGWIYDEPDSLHPTEATLIDPLTQGVVLNLGHWQIPAPSRTGPVLMMLTERQSTRTWLGLLTTGPRVDVLGTATELTQDSFCEVDDGYLACLTTNAQLRIWRYRK